MRFLVVDDEPDVLLLIDVNIRRWGHETVTADTLADARRLCATDPPDVLLLDVTMPETDGPTFLRQLRAEGIAPPRVYLLSAVPPDQLEELAGELDVGFVRKPFTAQSLRDGLAAALREEGGT